MAHRELCFVLDEKAAKFQCFYESFKKITTYFRSQIMPKFVLMNPFRLNRKNAGSHSRVFTVIASAILVYCRVLNKSRHPAIDRHLLWNW